MQRLAYVTVSRARPCEIWHVVQGVHKVHFRPQLVHGGGRVGHLCRLSIVRHQQSWRAFLHRRIPPTPVVHQVVTRMRVARPEYKGIVASSGSCVFVPRDKFCSRPYRLLPRRHKAGQVDVATLETASANMKAPPKYPAKNGRSSRSPITVTCPTPRSTVTRLPQHGEQRNSAAVSPTPACSSESVCMRTSLPLPPFSKTSHVRQHKTRTVGGRLMIARVHGE